WRQPKRIRKATWHGIGIGIWTDKTEGRTNGAIKAAQNDVVLRRKAQGLVESLNELRGNRGYDGSAKGSVRLVQPAGYEDRSCARRTEHQRLGNVDLIAFGA